MRKKGRKIISFILLLAMMLSMLAGSTISVFADDIQYKQHNIARYFTGSGVPRDDDPQGVTIGDYTVGREQPFGNLDQLIQIHWGTCEGISGDFRTNKDHDYFVTCYNKSDNKIHLFRVERDKPWHKEPDTPLIKNVEDIKQGACISGFVGLGSQKLIIPNSDNNDVAIHTIWFDDKGKRIMVTCHNPGMNKEYRNTSSHPEYAPYNYSNVIDKILCGDNQNTCKLTEDTAEWLLATIIDETIDAENLSKMKGSWANYSSGSSFTTAKGKKVTWDEKGTDKDTYYETAIYLVVDGNVSSNPSGEEIGELKQHFEISANGANKKSMMALNNLIDTIEEPSPKNYPRLWNLWKVYHEWRFTAEELEEKRDEAAIKQLEKEYGQLKNSNLYSMYAYLIQRYAVEDGHPLYDAKAWSETGTLNTEYPSFTEILGNIHLGDIESSVGVERNVTYTTSSGGTSSKNIPGIKIDDNNPNSQTTMTTDQLLRLKVMYFTARAKVKGQDKERVWSTKDFIWNDDLSQLKETTINASVNNSTDQINNAKAAVSDMSSLRIDQLGSISRLTILNRAEEISRYLIPMVLGYEYDDGLSISDGSQLPVSDILNMLLPLDDNGKIRTTDNVGVYNKCPQFRNINRVAPTEQAYTAYYNLQLLYLIMESYVQDKIELTEDGKWEPGELCKGKSDEEKRSICKGYQSEIIALVKMHTALDNLGVDYTSNNSEVSDRLKAFLSYYNDLKEYRNDAYSDTLMNTWDGSGSITDPMRALFTLDIPGQVLTADYLTGVKLSASFIPLRTNMYDLSSMNELEDIDWIARFHYGYGFYRKALYIDTNVNSAVEWWVSDKGKGITKVATLRDLLQTERDIMLYVDDSYYNLDILKEQLDGFQNRAKLDYDDGSTKSSEDTSILTSSKKASLTDSNTLDLAGLVKSKGKKVYSLDVRDKVKDDQFTTDPGLADLQDNSYVMNSAEIDEYLNVNSMSEDKKYHDEYSVAQSFAVVSSIYRHNGLFETIRSESSNPYPVFVSSPTLWQLEGINYSQFLCAYNYLMLKNLEAQLGIDYESTLDLDAPLYVDIYGNILTESGLVVIPAASNPTLYNTSFNDSGYTIYNAGFLTYYNNGNYYLPNTENTRKFVKDYFMGLDEMTDTYRVGVTRFQGFGVDNKNFDFRNISFSNSEHLKLFMKLQERSLSSKSLKENFHIYLITEVLRGAPIDEIRKENEGLLDSAYDPSSFEIYIASKLEKLVDQMLPIQNGNTWVTLPNLAFMENVEYVFLFIFKVLIVGLLLLLVYRLYIDAVDGVLGIKSMFSFVLSAFIVLVAMFSIPYFMDLSYYQVNKQLLQDEISYISMLNVEKRLEGREIGLTEIGTPESATELYLKVDDVSIPWYRLIDDILFHPTTKTLTEAYEEEFNSSLVANLPGMIKRGNGIYIPLSTIYDTSVLSYDLDENLLQSGVTETAYASYITPYYVVLENLVQLVNRYNNDPDLDATTDDKINQYETVIQAGGVTRTKGLITSYFLSNEFMSEEGDITGFRKVYDGDYAFSRLTETNHVDNQIERIKRSDWYHEAKTPEGLEENLSEVEDYAREFVINNKAVLGKVTDETFLKVMAMSIAVKHNDVFGSRNGASIEIYEVDARDIIRLSVADRSTVLRNSSKSFSRFVFTTSGAMGTLLTALLVCIYFISAIVKPVCIGIMLIIMIASLIVRRMVKRDDFTAIEGFIITLAILCGINAIYALVLKGSIMLANTGISTLISITIQIIIQLVYILLLVGLTKMVITNWETFGQAAYAQVVQNVSNVFSTGSVGNVMERFRFNNTYRNSPRSGDRYERDAVYVQRTKNKERREKEPSLVGLTSTQYMDLLNGRDERRRDSRGRR